MWFFRPARKFPGSWSPFGIAVPDLASYGFIFCSIQYCDHNPWGTRASRCVAQSLFVVFSALRPCDRRGLRPLILALKIVSLISRWHCDAQADLTVRWAHMSFCWFYPVAAEHECREVCGPTNAHAQPLNRTVVWCGETSRMRRLAGAFAVPFSNGLVHSLCAKVGIHLFDSQ